MPRRSNVMPGAACGACGQPLVSERDALPWCESCEWNLDAFDRRSRAPGWRWIDRLTFGWALRRSTRDFALWARAGVHRPRRTTWLALQAVSAVLLAGWALLLFTGIRLVLTEVDGWLMIGVLCLVLAYGLRPRFGHLDDELPVATRERLPALHELVDRVSAAVGTAPPDVIALTYDMNAGTAEIGLFRRRRVMLLGLPLWAVLPAQQRVALLGHEMGHFVNGDQRRAYLVAPAMTLVARLIEVLRPSYASMALAGPGGLIIRACTGATSWLVSLLEFAMHVAAARGGHQAEYLADRIAARVAGDTAAQDLADGMVVLSEVLEPLGRSARMGAGPAVWLSSAEHVREQAAPRRNRLRQLSVREEASLFASHPPSGLRARMLESHRADPPRAALVELTAEQNARIDAELASRFEELRQAVSAR
ncbi:M48 family metallopeptidase [Catellatospora vulcania]|uniref:M48 family metallopeptidase n=1 Tax=Catellatospora vulcania TaxID=1460450 RepID=UPI0012D3AD19|nr:M48 family metallopeptidase [Catellatospora vulcania]